MNEAQMQVPDDPYDEERMSVSGELQDMTSADASVAKGELRPLEKSRLALYMLTFVLDMAVLFASFRIVPELTSIFYEVNVKGEVLLAAIPIFVVIAIYNRVYSIKGLESFQHAMVRLSLALAVTGVLFFSLGYYLRPESSHIRESFVLAMMAAATGMTLIRAGMAIFVKRQFGGSVFHVLIIEDGGPAIPLRTARRMQVSPTLAQGAVKDPKRLDALGKRMQFADRVIISCPTQKRNAWAQITRASGVHSEIFSESLNQLGILDVVRQDNLAFLVVSTGPLGLRSRVIKRVTDLVVSAVAVLALSPLLLLVALAIKLEDGGPVFFVQPRIGKGNRIFKLYKFRSMHADKLDKNGDTSTAIDDKRVTRIGRLIRATSVDELPQLFNVLLSEMSLVGPRPHALGSLAGTKLFWEVDRQYWQRHALKPGMTGLAQVRGHRGATDTEAHLTNRLQSDLEYIRDWSPWLDVKIMLATLKVLVPERA